ncbi:hypothetical protein SAMN05216343_12340 [Oscillibacter sp. PC13]|uniref:hypothetical protein n=1 Tax=Oscillibacter sp. PC13 TaxID=1855299 RepID=UPI0008E8980A|nr:hypothetical protein [Oscillibacter sp. PC13]SFQ09030.1 hypothetical protein SAMN05216343_12340 [Oscillibacter sp. PC13]
MTYKMKAGILYSQDGSQVLVRIRSKFCGPEKEILDMDGSLLFTADIRILDYPPQWAGNISCREYVLTAPSGEELAVGKPRYADSEDPPIYGWPICRMPRVDRADLDFAGNAYTLVMRDSQNYVLLDNQAAPAVQIKHRGITGGWAIESVRDFSAGHLCGIFAFCRYIERENEFPVV